MDQFTTGVRGFTSLLARLSLAFIFVASAIGNGIPQFQQTAEYMASEGVPSPKFALFGAIGLLLIGGLSVVAGSWTRVGAGFWTFADPAVRQLQTIQFMKNLAIAGGLLALMAFGGGPWSVDGWIAMKEEEAGSAPSSKSRGSAKMQQAA